jgi:hypothetical protein
MTTRENHTPAEFEAAFIEFVAKTKVKVETDRDCIISYEPGRRYIRIISTYHDQRSCFGFVDATNGDVLKSAGWKAPAKNFARGNIFDANNGTARVSPYSIQ